MATLTAANSTFALGVAGLYAAPQLLQGYATDNAFAAEAVQSAEVVMGVDGRLSGGFTPVPKPVTIMLQADSPSHAVFANWIAAQEAAKEILIATATISIPGTRQKYALTRGILTSYVPFSPVEKILRARPYVVTWELISEAPF